MSLLRRKRVTDRQMAVLEAFVAQSRDAGAIAKRILIWALRRTANLTKPVHVFIPRVVPAWEDFFSTGGFLQIDRMCGSSGRLSYFLEGMGSEFDISTWGLEEGHHLTISSKDYDKGLPAITPTRDKVESVSVRHPYGACNAKGEPYITIR